ncbi:Ig-like domain-containing protein [[Ruminococcus] torques]|uniref:Ig-like domain-containing protein n=1 Tax=[Ruminococcus] torques TaxID=33039 RepID=UPI0024302499|nr:Ig-like domain-containing protein [[Ruminococcus] torques]
MRLKKFLSAALSAAMLISSVSFGGTVVQATQERGENIAESNKIVAHSGNDGSFTINYAMDGEGNNNSNDNYRWLSQIRLKGNAYQQGDAAYIVFDMGENGPRSYEEIKIRFHNRAYATDYKIYTKDENNYGNAQHGINPANDGWVEIDHFTGRTTGDPTFPIDTFGKKTDTGRYLLFYFSDMRKNIAGVSDSISVREIEIYHKPIDSVAMDNEALSLKVGETSQLAVTISPEDATYKDVEWSSEDSDKVAVSEDGTVTAKATGTVAITATCKDDRTKTAICTVTVTPNVDKSDLEKALEEARALIEADYTESSWSLLQEVVEEANNVYQAQDSTQNQIDDAAAAIRETINALVRVYKVTVVNGDSTTVVDRGEYGKFVTVIAPEAPEGQIFAGWKNGDVTVSTKESYSFYLVGDVTLTATYQNAGQEVVQSPGAMLSNVLFKETTAGKYRVSFVCQLSMPEGYELQEAGVFWSKTNMSSLHNEDGTAASGARKVNAKSTNNQYQYVININNVPSGFTLYQEVFAKVKNTATGEFSWVYTTVTPVKVP